MLQILYQQLENISVKLVLYPLLLSLTEEEMLLLDLTSK
jgi:hypothetical protein